MTGRTQGFTLVELLIAMALLMVVLTIAFNIFSSSNKLVETDTGRVMAQQNAQTALDLMAADVRQAGENLELDLGISGVEFSDTANSITVRRSIPPQASGIKLARLPLCAVSGTTAQIVGPVPGSSTATARCTYSDGNSDNEDDNVAPWRTYFSAQGGKPQAALLYRPASGSTPALIKSTTVRTIQAQQIETVAGTTVRRVSVVLGTAVPSDFTPANNSLLILVDERRYMLLGTELRLALGGQTDSEAQPMAFGVTDLKLSAALTGPTETVTSMDLTSSFRRVASVSVGLTAQNSGQGKLSTRTFTTTIFPRNIETARSTSGAK
ncbi:PilW family protein [uncultured Deinococcus sp.]|uniref:PilW family protein n=1 Tax=uncultured Deinococcus sp. TaxID=158789 RepID=UPI0025F6AB0D|nr:prepilin-type N-terminal cleavage/methylation domain-containing protein [uncultured Deinococcus sp.]